MRYISIFSGIEAASVAWEPLGFEPVCFSEIDPFPSAVLAERYPNVPNLGDITEVDWTKVVREHGAADLVVGGSPCQSFSIAGGRAGLDGESRLMYEYIRAVQEVRPRWLLWENVPGVLSIDSGRAFGILLDELAALGYALAWRMLDAQFFGVAQRRLRLFVVGYLGDPGCAAAVLFDRESLSGNIGTLKAKREALASGTRTSPGRGDLGEQGKTSVASAMMPSQVLKLRHTGSSNNGRGGEGALIGEEVSFTLATSQDQTLFTKPAQLHDASGYVVRRLMPRECERLQGFPDGWTDIQWKGKPAPDSKRYKALGNSMAVPVMRWIGSRLAMVEEILDEHRSDSNS